MLYYEENGCIDLHNRLFAVPRYASELHQCLLIILVNISCYKSYLLTIIDCVVLIVQLMWSKYEIKVDNAL